MMGKVAALKVTDQGVKQTTRILETYFVSLEGERTDVVLLMCVCQCVCVRGGMWCSPAVDLSLATGQVSRDAASLYSGTAELGLQKRTQSNTLTHIYGLICSIPPKHTRTKAKKHKNTQLSPLSSFSYSYTSSCILCVKKIQQGSREQALI